jgi:uncharacterized membrane protein YidH (DUF202 family)
VTSPIPDRAALQPERTALAWQRTAITATVILIPLVIVDLRLGAWPLAVIGSVAAIAAGAVVLRLRRRFARLREEDVGYSPYWHMVRVALACGLAATGGVVTAAVVLLR